MSNQTIQKAEAQNLPPFALPETTTQIKKGAHPKNFSWFIVETSRLTLETLQSALEISRSNLEIARLTVETVPLALETLRFNMETARLALEIKRLTLETPRIAKETATVPKVIARSSEYLPTAQSKILISLVHEAFRASRHLAASVHGAV